MLIKDFIKVKFYFYISMPLNLFYRSSIYYNRRWTETSLWYVFLLVFMKQSKYQLISLETNYDSFWSPLG